jgi:MinD-like ATPase involved in chromosome partitioning or flagellar assembly
LDNNEQDEPVGSGPARPRSVWADMVLSGSDDQDEPGSAPGSPAESEAGAEPGARAESGAGAEPGDLGKGAPGWPASGLPPLFGQRSAEGERPPAEHPAVDRPAADWPGSGTGHGGFRPLGSLPPSGPPPGGGWGATEARPDEPAASDCDPREAPGGWYSEEPAGAPDEEARAAEAAFGPWETYETGESYGWNGGYGVVAGEGWARSYDDEEEPYAEAQPYGEAPYDEAQPAGEAPAGAHAGSGPHASPGGHLAYGIVAPGAAQDAIPPGAPPETEPHDAGTSAEPDDQPEWQAESADSLTADMLLRGRHAAPPPGWRRALYRVSGGLVRAPQSAADRRRQDLVARARTPVAGGHHRVAVLSLKGGVGKTTTTVGLGSTLASLRGDRVIAVDANPDRGTLCDKLRLETAATVRDLLNEEDQIQRYADVRAYTTQAASGLEVLASDRDPTVSVAFSAEDYEDVARVLEHYYSVSITDCGTGLLHSAMAGVLHLADQIVLVSSPSVDGARSASATLDWLAAHRYGDLVRGAVVVISAIRPRSKSAVDLTRLEQHFAARCRAVVRIPYDAHLEEGAEVDLAQLSRATADAFLVLAADVGDGFSWPRH